MIKSLCIKVFKSNKYLNNIKSMFKSTIVSAFMCNVMPRPDRATDIYYEHALGLLTSPAPKVIFLDEPMYNLVVEKNQYDPTTTLIIQFNKDKMLWYDKKETLINNVITPTPDKDTVEFFITICNKTNWVNQAIELNPFNTDQFVWIDFGIHYVFKGSVPFSHTSELISNIAKKEYDLIRIGNIVDFNLQYSYNIKTNICWYFAGGVFGGKKDALIFFNELMCNHCNNMIDTDNCLLWEVNIWNNIYREIPQLFSPYKCDHDLSILVNY